MEGLLKDIENMLTRGRLDLPLTLCFAILREDDYLLHQLLRRGLDPNESDNNGHTALVRILYLWISKISSGTRNSNSTLFLLDVCT